MTETAAPAPNAQFDALIAADRLVHTLHALAAAGSDVATRERNKKAIPAAKAAFFALLDELTPAQLPEFMAYRRAMQDLTV